MDLNRRLSTFLNRTPDLGSGVFVAPNAIVVGDVRVGQDSSIWYGATLRADINYISVGRGTNLQDGMIGHMADEWPLVIGHYVTVGHGAMLHACKIADECLVGMRATIMDGAQIGRQSIIAAGSVVPKGMIVPEGSMVAGIPADIKKSLTKEKRNELRKHAEKYVQVRKKYLELFDFYGK